MLEYGDLFFVHFQSLTKAAGISVLTSFVAQGPLGSPATRLSINMP